MAATQIVIGSGSQRAMPARLEIDVVYTGVQATLPALREAACLADHLHARIRIIAPTVVPFPLPLDRPAVPAEYHHRRFRVLAGADGVETNVHLCYCRDELDGLKSVLGAHSLVVIGGTDRWWPTKSKRWAKALRKAGHQVIFVDTGGKHA